MIFYDLFYILLGHSIVVYMPIVALLCAWLQIDMVLICCEAHYLVVCVSHLLGNARAIADSLTQLIIVVVEHHVIVILLRSI